MLSSAATFSKMIKLSHTIFALPFALAATVLAGQQYGWSWAQVGWILVCMVGARSAAMGFNRIADRDIDAANPRTVDREIPAGRLSLRSAWAWTLGSAGLFVLGAGMLSPLCLWLSPVVLAVVCGYSLTKRFTALCHLFLGLALALAPTCAWIALADRVDPPALVLSAIVGTWVAGFDILYALNDEAFDRDRGLHSIPAALGRTGALVASAALHVVTIGALAALPFVAGLSWLWWPGFALIVGVLVYEHWIVRPDDLSRLDQAFFQLNGIVSLAVFGAVLLAL